MFFCPQINHEQSFMYLLNRKKNKISRDDMLFQSYFVLNQVSDHVRAEKIS